LTINRFTVLQSIEDTAVQDYVRWSIRRRFNARCVFLLGSDVMSGIGISKELFDEIERLAMVRQAGNSDALLNDEGLLDREREAVRLLNQVLENCCTSDMQSIWEEESGVAKAQHDSLTSVYNRQYFDNNIDSLILALSGSAGKLSLMTVDIDCFNAFNNTFSYFDGDECLRIVAEVLQECTMREEHYVARYGDEKFVVVLPNTNAADACELADKLLSGVRERNIPHPKNTAADHVTISIGIVSGQVRHTHTRDDFLKRADEMLYKS
jgi:diguanylate cyclase (GGDEF)-like protein